jgi:uncharacterized protein (TIGR02284 family)
MTNRQARGALESLYRIVEAGERGFSTAATNVKNRGLKLLFKSYAQQRAAFKSEILTELKRLGSDYTPTGSIFGMIHRGRVAIFSAMTIELDQREKVVLKEAAVGERYAAQTYRKTLAAPISPETRELVTRQFEEVRQVVEDIHHMLGKDGQTLLVQLYDEDQDANSAIQALKTASFPVETVEKIDIDTSIDLYHGKGTTIRDTILSGMVGGVVWGSLIGVLAGFGAVQTDTAAWIGVNSVLGTWALIALSTIILAAIMGGILGLFIGVGLSEDDSYAYKNSALHGEYLVKALVDSSHAREAREILKQNHQPTRETTAGVSA